MSLNVRARVAHLVTVFVALLVVQPLPAHAQIAPVGRPSAGHPSDTGYEGAVNSQGGYGVSVPLDLPAARGGLPLPLQVVHNGRQLGAAGVGWDVPLSYIYRDTTVAHRRPAGNADVDPQAREQLSLVLNGERIDLVPAAPVNGRKTWTARRNAAQMEVRAVKDPQGLFLYDGEGRTYGFSSRDAVAGSSLAGGNLYLLSGITGPGRNNNMILNYAITHPTLPGGGTGTAINLDEFFYNQSPTLTGWGYKNRVLLRYDVAPPAGSAPLSISMLGNTALVRTQKLSSIIELVTPTSSETVLRTYNFNYQTDPDTALPQLHEVTMTGRQGTPEAGVALPVAKYSYGQATGVDGKLTYRKTQSVALPSTVETTFGISYTTDIGIYTAQELVDLNGDGRPDLVYTDTDGHVWVERNAPNTTPRFGGPAQLNFFNDGPVGSFLNFPERQDNDTGFDGPNPNLYYSPLEDGTSSRSGTSRQLIDVNGDGRMDVVGTAEPGLWTINLNTPNPVDATYTSWQRKTVSTDPLVARLRAAGHSVPSAETGDVVALKRVTTTHDKLFNQCWQWRKDASGKLSWQPEIAGFTSFARGTHCEGPQGMDSDAPGFGSIDFPAKTITEWELKDINGDGYPDFVYNASPVGAIVGPNPEPRLPGGFEGQFAATAIAVVHDLTGSGDVMAVLNTAGAHLAAGAWPSVGGPYVFSAPITLEVGGATRCGVSRWREDFGPTGTKVLLCDFIDVNGDGLVDRVTSTVQHTPTSFWQASAAPGTGDMSAPFNFGATIALPGALGRTRTDLVLSDDSHEGHFKPSACPTAPASIPPDNDSMKPPHDTYPIQSLVALRDINGDGIPDYVSGQPNGSGTDWSVAFGTGTGFVMPATPVNSEFGFEVSLEAMGCFSFNSSSAVTRGLYDMDGDGRPEVVVLNGTNLDQYQLNAQQDPQHPFNGNVPSSPTEGRLLTVDNSYGAITHIAYRSAKEDGSTMHEVPFPEVVVASVGTSKAVGSPLLTSTEFAYGNAGMIFDPVYDGFRFPGYGRTIKLRITSDQVFPPPTDGMATITDRYQLPRFDPNAPNHADPNERFKRYVKAGNVSDVTTLSGTIGGDPWALLTADIATDSRRINGSHHDFDTRLLPGAPPVDVPGTEECLDMVSPYDYDDSKSNSLGLDQCQQHGFAFETSVFSWRGTPGTADPRTSTQTVQISSTVNSVDDFGRVTSATQNNDARRSDDDQCVQAVYATATGAGSDPVPRVLNAPVSRTVTNCAAPATLSQVNFEYDTLPSGSVSTGFVTGETVSRIDLDTGAVLETIREFDTTYDAATGNPKTITKTRGDGATKKVTMTYDPSFGLALVSIKTEATNADGSALPSLITRITPDPFTLQTASVEEPNGTTYGHTFDGFGRELLSTVTPPGGTEGVLSSLTYAGFARNTGVRTLIKKVFTDAVAAANVPSAVGRTTTTILDELGREQVTQVQLGADYANQNLIVRQRIYDQLGRVFFEADPFPSTQSVGTAYGTTHYFNVDGTPSCTIRGNFIQPLSQRVDQSKEVYPTCFERSFDGNQEVVDSRDAASLLAGFSRQAGVRNRSVFDALGRLRQRATLAPNLGGVGSSAIEDATFGYDALGNMTTMVRYLNPVASVPVTWHYDSLGQILELDEPDTAPQLRSYDSWGELTQVHWTDTTGAPTVHSTNTRYDAFGRVTHRDEQNQAGQGPTQIDPATVYDYAYDQGVNTAAPAVTATNVLGRMVRAISPTSTAAFSYDALGRVNATTYTDTSVAPNQVYVEKHDYHGDGSLQTLHFLLPDTTAFVDEHVDYSYDSAGRARSVHYADGAINQALFAASGSSDIDPFGRIRQAQYGAATYTASYADTGRRLIHDVAVFSPVPLVTSREISYQNPVFGAAIPFDPVGRERQHTEIQDGDLTTAQTSDFGYDPHGWLERADRETRTSLLSTLEFGNDALGNLVVVDDQEGGTTKNRVLSYKSSGDRDRICSISYVEFGRPNPVCEVKYDGVGNIIEQPSRLNGKRTLSYFANGQTKRVSDEAGNEAQFRYDAFGAVQQLDLTNASESADTRHDRHFGAFLLQHEEVVDGAHRSVLTRIIPTPGGTATRHGHAPTDPWVFAFGEARGNRFFTDQTGAFVQDVDYDPYGEVTKNSCGADSTPCIFKSPTYSSDQWNGRDALAALGLSQLGARLYDPAIGRFLSRDPLIIPRTAGTTNPYAFAMNDPVNGSDPSGLDDAWNDSTNDHDAPPPEIIYVQDQGTYDFFKQGYDVSGCTGCDVFVTEEVIGFSGTLNVSSGASGFPLTPPLAHEDIGSPYCSECVGLSGFARHWQSPGRLNSVQMAPVQQLGVAANGLREVQRRLHLGGPFELVGNAILGDLDNEMADAEADFAGRPLDPNAWLERAIDITSSNGPPPAAGGGAPGGGAPGGGAPRGVKVLQSGGNTIDKATAKALGLTQQQARDAMHKLKPFVGADPRDVGKIMSNGDYVSKKTGEVLGNLFDFVDGRFAPK